LVVRSRLALSLTVASIVSLLAPASGHAGTPRWSTAPVADDVASAALGIDGSGTGTALFDSHQPGRVFLSNAPTFEPYSEPEPFGPLRSFHPLLAVSPRDEAIALYQDQSAPVSCDEPSCPGLVARIRPEGGGAFSAAKPLALPAFTPVLAMNRHGGAVAAWRAGGEIHVSARRRGGEFGPSQTISQPGPPAGCAQSPQAAIDPAGDAIVVWTSLPACGAPHVWASYRRAGAGFGVPEKLQGDGAAVAVGLAPNGTATLVFTRASDTATTRRSRDGDWSPARHLGPRGAPHLGSSGSDDDGLFYWLHEAGADSRTYATRLDRSGRLSPAFTILPRGVAAPRLGIDTFGNVFATYADPATRGAPIHAAVITHLGPGERTQIVIPRVAGEPPPSAQALVVSDAGAADAAYVETTDESNDPPATRFIAVRHPADQEAPKLDPLEVTKVAAGVRVRTACDEVCRLRSKLRITRRTPGGGHRFVLGIHTRWFVRATDRTATMTIHVGPKARKRIRELLHDGAHLDAFAIVLTQDAWSSPSSARQRVAPEKVAGG
jgi:hypothetical protein